MDDVPETLKEKKWHKRWFVRWPLIAVAAFLVLDYIVLPIGMGIYVNVAPKPSSCCKTPADYSMDFEWVNLKNTDGSKLVGWFVPSENKKTIILMHGASSTKSTLLDHAAFLHAAGYNTFLLDAHGHGDSEGRNMEYGWNAANDVKTVIDWLQKQPNVDDEKIALLGLSMGGEGALSAAAVDTRVKAVVAEGATVHTLDEARTIPNATWYSYPFDWLMFTTIGALSDDPEPVSIPEAMRHIQPRKVLLISGDDTQERALNPIYDDLGGDSTTHWALDDTPHTGGLSKHPDEYKERLLDFFATSQ